MPIETREAAGGSGAPRLNVLHIAESYPPEYGGGAALYVRDVCHALAHLGHTVRVLATEARAAADFAVRTEWDGAVQIDRVNLPYFKQVDPDGWRLGLLGWRRHQRRVARFLEPYLGRWLPDIVHYHSTRPLGEEVLSSVKRQRVPLVAMLHDAWLICPRVMLLRSPTSEACSGPRPQRCLLCQYSHYDGTRARAAWKLPWRALKLGMYPAYRLWRRWVVRRTLAGAVGNSQFITDRHAPHLPGVLRHLPLGINLEGLPDERPVRPRTPFRFGFIGGFQPTKGIVPILDAAARLKQEGRSFEVHVWGPGLEEGRREVQARSLEDRVILRGSYGAGDLWPVYQEIDVALMATLVCEPFGRVPQEAAALGAPTIAPAVGGLTEQIRDDVDGLLYEFRNPHDLERQMRRVLVEPDLLPRLIRNLWTVVDTRRRGAEIEHFYRAVLDRHDRGARRPSEGLRSAAAP